MAIYRILQNSPLGPDEITRLSKAYEQALRTIGVQDRNDPLTELIAKKIIEISQTGLKDPAQICVRAVEALGSTTVICTVRGGLVGMRSAKKSRLSRTASIGSLSMGSVCIWNFVAVQQPVPATAGSDGQHRFDQAALHMAER